MRFHVWAPGPVAFGEFGFPFGPGFAAFEGGQVSDPDCFVQNALGLM